MNKKKSKGLNIAIYVIIAVIIFTVALILLLKPSQKPKQTIRSTTTINTMGNTEFRKDGEVSIVDKDNLEEKVRIEVEIADNDYERAQGLMYREHMDMNRGMLFFMEREEYQGFWMKNTAIPLDILYVSSEKIIVSIHENCVPYSLESIYSKAPAITVLEVNAGFVAKYNIKEGDRLVF
ncbi:MAG: DUF192 domain-containing protein [Bacteroidales bacterium]|jgi:uncharacterized membrane protein (UPF0127 family)